MDKLKLNHVAIWIAIVLQFALGFLWYGPLFGEKWKAYTQINQAAAETNSAGIAIWLTNLLTTVLGMYLLAWLFVKIDIRSAVKGLYSAFLISFIFIFLNALTTNLFAQFPYGLAWITGGFSMVGFSIAGVIYGAWTKKA